MFTPADTISIPTSRLKENIPDIAAITGNTLWGFSLLLSKTALNYAPTSILLSMRFIIAFLLMNLILLFKIERISLKGKNILPVLLLALNDVAYFYCESYGIALTNSMFTGVVLSLIPILAMGLSALFLKEFPTLRQILFSFLPVAGVVIIILAGSSSGAIQPVGILFVLSACFLSATQRVINRKAAVNFSAFERTYFTICSSCLFFTTNAVHQLGGNAMKLLHYATIPGFIIPVLILSRGIWNNNCSYFSSSRIFSIAFYSWTKVRIIYKCGRFFINTFGRRFHLSAFPSLLSGCILRLPAPIRHVPARDAPLPVFVPLPAG